MRPRPRKPTRWDARACDIIPDLTDDTGPLYRWARDHMKAASQRLGVGEAGIRYAADKRGYSPRSGTYKAVSKKNKGVPQCMARAIRTDPTPRRAWQEGAVRDVLEVQHR